MSKKNLTRFIFCLLIFSQFSVSNNFAQTNNPRYFNERFVIKSLQTIYGAQITYNVTVGNGNNFGSLDDLRKADFIDAVLASGEKHGYYFAVTKTDRTATAPAGFCITATPRSYRKTGRRSFYIDESGELHGADKNGALATATDALIDSCFVYDNEKCVISDLRTLHSAQVTYQSSAGNGDFGSLSELYTSRLIHRSLASGTTHGYKFTLTKIAGTSTTPAFFKISAVPEKYGVTGTRSFHIDTVGVLRGADKKGEPANEKDPPIDY